jgi:type I restriction enzyme S subunit
MHKDVTTEDTEGMKNKAYPKYKPSGVDWLGDVPEHWEVTKIGYQTTLDVGYAFKSDKFTDEGIRLLRGDNITEGVTRWGEKSRHWPLDEPVANRFLLEVNDLVISMDGSKVGKNYALITERDLPAYLVQRVARLKSKNIATLKYIFRLVGLETFRQYVDVVKTDPAIPHITAKNILDYPIGLPPLPEQQAIASFLDRETGRIDSLIAKKQRLLELLAEQRTALISATVTGKIDITTEDTEGTEKGNKQFREFRAFRGYPKYKPSGVEWLGDIPKHWVVTELRRFIRFITSGSRGWAEHYSDAGKIFVRIGNLTRHSIDIDLSDIQYVDPPEGAEGERTKIASGDILFSITAYIGSVAVATEEIAGAYINQHIALVRPLIDKIYPRFVAYAGFSDYGQAQLSGQGYGGTKVQLALDDVKSLRIALPPLPEQQAIAAFLDRETAKIDALSAKVVTVIERLKEYRTALISSAVTGKIDVREAV